MYISPQQLFSKGSRDDLSHKIIQFPIVRIFLALLFLVPAILCFNLLYKNMEPRWTTFRGDIGAIIIIFLYYFSYSMYTKFIEKRSTFELSSKGFVRETGIGFILGSSLVIITTISIFSIGTFQIAGTNPSFFLIHAFFIFGLLAFAEDLIFRGIIFRLIEEMAGSWLSILVVAAMFGMVHMIHEQATVLSTVSIALQDLVLSAAFILTRRVWLCWGIHWGWNFFQDGILGMPNSGVTALPSWLIPKVSGPIWLTGGSIGIEQSALGVLLNIILGIVIIKLAIARGQMLPPRWKRYSLPD